MRMSRLESGEYARSSLEPSTSDTLVLCRHASNSPDIGLPRSGEFDKPHAWNFRRCSNPEKLLPARASAAAAAAAAAAARAALRSWASFVDCNGSPAHLFTIQGGNGGLSLVAGWHFYKCESPGASRIAVAYYGDFFHLPMGRESLLYLLFAHFIWKVPYIDPQDYMPSLFLNTVNLGTVQRLISLHRTPVKC